MIIHRKGRTTLLGRDRRQDRREERQDDRRIGRPGGGGKRYQMRQKMVAIGDDFWIENEHLQSDWQSLARTKDADFEDAHCNELCKIQEHMLRIKDSMEIEGLLGEQLAMVKKALVTPLR